MGLALGHCSACKTDDSSTPTGPTSQKDPFITAAIAKISDSSLASYVTSLQNFGTRYYSNTNRDSIVSWIQARFLSFGVIEVSLHSFSFLGTAQKNVVATLPGGDLHSQEIIICGHYDSNSTDTLKAPGADDNASGTAGVIELARVLKLMGYQPRRTLRFICLAAEEKGARGSLAYAQNARAQSRDIRLTVNFDMIAYRGTEQATYNLYSPDTSGAQLAVGIIMLYTEEAPVLKVSGMGPDDASFYYAGYTHTLFFTDLIHRYPFAHSPSDLLDKLDMNYERKILQAALAVILTVDQMP